MSKLRIACLAAEIPEILHRLGALDHVVGISAYTTRPPEALNIPKVSGFKHGSVDRILSTAPDIAILTSGVQRTLAAELAERGVPILHLNPHRLDDLFDTIRVLGQLTGHSAQAEQLTDDLCADIEQVRQLGEQLPWHPRVYFEEWMDPLIAGTGWVSDIIEIAGGVDVFREKSIHGRNVSGRMTLRQFEAATCMNWMASSCNAVLCSSTVCVKCIRSSGRMPSHRLARKI